MLKFNDINIHELPTSPCSEAEEPRAELKFMSCLGLWRVVLLLPGVIYVAGQFPCAILENSFIFINVSRRAEGAAASVHLGKTSSVS